MTRFGTPQTPSVPITGPSTVCISNLLGLMTDLLREAHSSLDRLNTAVRALFFNFSTAFNTILPRLPKAKMENVQVDFPLVRWVHDYLTDHRM